MRERRTEHRWRTSFMDSSLVEFCEHDATIYVSIVHVVHTSSFKLGQALKNHAATQQVGGETFACVEQSTRAPFCCSVVRPVLRACCHRSSDGNMERRRVHGPRINATAVLQTAAAAISASCCHALGSYRRVACFKFGKVLGFINTTFCKSRGRGRGSHK